MTLEEKFAEMFPEYVAGSVFLSPYWDLFEAGAEIATEEMQEDLKHKKIAIQNRKARIKDLEKQIEKMKCCGNCKYQVWDECGESCDYKGVSGVSGDCDKWEIKEND